MVKIYKKMKKAAIKDWFKSGFILLIIAPILFFGAGGTTAQYFFTTEDVSEMSAYSVEEETYYKCDVYALIDYYAEDEEGNYYIMPDGDGHFWGLYLPYEYEAQAEQIMDATFEYLTNDEAEYVESDDFMIKGYAYRMSTDEQAYFDETLDLIGVDAMDRYYYTFVPVTMGQAINVVELVIMVVGLGLFVVAIYLLIAIFRGKFKEPVDCVMSSYGITEDMINADAMFLNESKLMDYGNKYAFIYGKETNMFVADKLVWAYLHVTNTKHRLYGVIPCGTTHSYKVIVYMDNGLGNTIPINKESQAKEILSVFEKMNPNAFYGYSQELSNMASTNFQGLVDAVHERMGAVE